MPKVRVEVRLLHSMATAITDGCTPLWPPNMHLSSPLPHRPPVTGKIAMVLAIDDLSCPHRRRGRWRWLWLLRTWRRRISMPQIKWYYYLILGIVDVEANYIVVKAYQYTSLTSVMLLDCWSIPCVIFLTWIFLKTKYGLRKFIGVGVCVAGLILVVFSDAHASDRAKGPNPLKGDLFVIAGSMLYAVSNVTEEYFVKKSNRVEVMAMLGVFGAIISGIQISILERQELRSTHWNAGALLPFIGFALAMFLFYSTVPIILKICGATMLNLSLLTSDMWAVLIRIFAYHEKVDWMYFVAFAGTAAGLAIYSYKGSTEAAEDTAQVAGAMDEEAAMENRAARVPGAGDDGPVPNKGFSSTATTSRQ